jgi:uncharacterized coiled-coil DUF342 family protein
MLKCNSKRAENNKLFMKTADADWHTLINKLNELADDLSKLKEADQQLNKMLKTTQQTRALWMQVNWSKNSVQKQLSRIEKKLNNLTEKMIQWIRLSWTCEKNEVQWIHEWMLQCRAYIS